MEDGEADRFTINQVQLYFYEKFEKTFMIRNLIKCDKRFGMWPVRADMAGVFTLFYNFMDINMRVEDLAFNLLAFSYIYYYNKSLRDDVMESTDFDSKQILKTFFENNYLKVD